MTTEQTKVNLYKERDVITWTDDRIEEHQQKLDEARIGIEIIEQGIVRIIETTQQSITNLESDNIRDEYHTDFVDMLQISLAWKDKTLQEEKDIISQIDMIEEVISEEAQENTEIEDNDKDENDKQGSLQEYSDRWTKAEADAEEETQALQNPILASNDQLMSLILLICINRMMPGAVNTADMPSMQQYSQYFDSPHQKFDIDEVLEFIEESENEEPSADEQIDGLRRLTRQEQVFLFMKKTRRHQPLARKLEVLLGKDLKRFLEDPKFSSPSIIQRIIREVGARDACGFNWNLFVDEK